jgi:hypothetical protein
MNRRKSKLINNQVKVILVEWLRSLVSEEQKDAITYDTILNHAPEKTYYFKNKSICLNSYNPKWVKKHIKYIIKRFPNLKLEDINFKVFEERRYGS